MALMPILPMMETSRTACVLGGLCLREVSLSVRLAQGSYIEGTEGGIINYLL